MILKSRLIVALLLFAFCVSGADLRKQAEASLKKGAPYIFIELQDVGYPGSTYTLMYHPQQDILAGFYFQAAVKGDTR